MSQAPVFRKTLTNGLNVLVVPRHHIPKVSLQIWYNVGAKDEGTGIWSEERGEWINQRGIAHLIEHMIFKGTKSMSESDINMLTYKLSGSCNAFTSHDYTGYLFDMPSQHWHEALPVMADCMSNCTFKQELLNSELKAVVQEIKMYNDDYVSTLIERMTSVIFLDHPYKYPVIGYKQDLWNLKRDDLEQFYKKHYGPNNATLVIVGDIQPDDVFKQVEEQFGAIKPLENYKKKEFYHSPDVGSQHVTMYRDVKQPILLLSWIVPGAREKRDYLLDLMSWIIGAGKGAKLYNKLVTELGIATELQSFVYDLFDYGMFFIYVQPNEGVSIEELKQIITKEIEYYRENLISDEELRRSSNKTEMDFLSLRESNEKQAYMLGKTFLVTGDENYLENYCNYSKDTIKTDIQDIFKNYFSSSQMHTGQMLPIAAQDKDLWLKTQRISDAEDTRILGDIIRDDIIEEPIYSQNIEVEKPTKFDFPKPQKFTLSNGLTVLYHNRPEIGKIDLVMDLKAKHFYDPRDKQGLSMFMTDMLQEGTKNRTSQELAHELESYGMELNTFPGQVGMAMLSCDFKKGLELLTEVLTEPAFDPESVERIRNQLLAELKLFWDSPRQFAGQLTREVVYKEHPYSQNIMGTADVIMSVTREELVDAHKRYISPHGARLGIVGDLSGVDIQELLESTLGKWQGPEVADKDFPKIAPLKPETVNYPMNRDQVVLSYGGVSVTRFDEDYDKLLLFDQVFTGGVLGGMNSRLFALREQTGLFYTIGGSVIAGVNAQPGMVYIRTIVSNDRLEEAERVIEETISEGAANLTQIELEEAQRALVNSMVDSFASNHSMATTFIILDKYELPDNYFDLRPNELYAVTVDDIKKIVGKYLDMSKMIKLRVGRVE